MWRIGLTVVAAIAGLSAPAGAQTFNPFGDLHTTRSFQEQARRAARLSIDGRSRLAPFGFEGLAAPPLLDGGPRPVISPMTPAAVPFRTAHAPGEIVIDTGGRALYLVQSGGTALRYPISVGREGFTWTGTEKISRVQDWPDWYPPVEMRERDPRLPEKMTGGIRNPLGVKALYLGSTLYRIHGTNDASTIGQAASSGCFRMMNGHVVDLASRVGIGTTVTVLGRLPAGATRAADDAVPVSRRPKPG
jgi:lipoprotein-anchoring transpeptidase ErfK/SrfK